jgi:DNA-binding SARP family transcriptional activator
VLTGVRFGLLGPIRAWRGEDELDVGSPQQRAVLAVLLLSDGRQVSIDDVVGALWGSDVPPTGTGTVRTYISRLRRVLAGTGEDGSGTEGEIWSGGGGYRLLTDPGQVDVSLFRRSLVAARKARGHGDLVEASRQLHDGLSLWHGAALTGLDGLFFKGRRAWLEQLRASAVEERLVVDIELGHHAEAVAELTVAVEEQPYRERLWELLMWALYRDGRQADALSTYRNIGQLLDRELGLEPGPSLREMHARILAADPSLVEGPSRLTNADRSVLTDQPGVMDKIRPAQLPRDESNFAGRVDEIANIHARLTNANQPCLIELTGAVGMGKTTLAVHAAHMANDQFPDGQFFACMREDSDGSGVDPAEVLAGFLRALAVDTSAFRSLSELAALWRTVLSKRRVMIILDDVVSSEQVLPLLPASGNSAVIVTSSQRLTDLPGIYSIKVGPLNCADAFELFAMIAGRSRVLAERAVSTRIVGMCSYQPVPVLRAAQWVRSRTSRTIAQIEELLYQELAQPLVNSAEFQRTELKHSRALDRLGPELARSCRLISVADCVRIDAPAAAALLDIPLSRASRILEALVGEHFLEADADGAYYFHRFMKIVMHRHALHSEGPTQCEAALKRLAEFASTKTNDDVLAITTNQSRYDTPDEKGNPRDWLSQWQNDIITILAQLNITGTPDTRDRRTISPGEPLMRSTD